ncbi:MAG: MOSC domain-containing protein [Pseudomonadales bacterium]|nr:MOSC domain-containing protein [Pseudomonadales bacterium]
MQVVQVSTGRRRRLEGATFNGETGIFKEARSGRVRVHALGVEDDAVVDTRHHGGPDQAVYLYRQEDYDWFTGELGREVRAGSFGENLTVSGLPEPGLPVGTRLRSPELELEVTAPRIPCRTLAQRMDDADFVRRFMAARRPGIYLRVLREGTVAAGDRFEIEAPNGPVVDTVEVFTSVKRRLTAEEIERLLSVPIDVRTRKDLEQRLARTRRA